MRPTPKAPCKVCELLKCMRLFTCRVYKVLSLPLSFYHEPSRHEKAVEHEACDMELAQ